MNWYVGQEVVCIKPHPQNKLRVGQHYIISAIIPGFCKCSDTLLDIGINNDTLERVAKCGICNTYKELPEGPYWFSSFRFSPVADIGELKDVLKKQQEKSIWHQKKLISLDDYKQFIEK